MIKYDINYYYNLLRIHASTAKQIVDIRYNFILKNAPTAIITFLDYGCGIGAMKAFAPDWVEVDTFDIMPVPQTGISRKKYDLVMFWDVLEHVDWKNNPDKKIEKAIQMGDYVAITVPILPEGKDYRTWKHRKPGEHLTRFRGSSSVVSFFKKRGFYCVAIGEDECPPRQDIKNFLFKKIRL